MKCSLDNLLWDGKTLNDFDPDRTHYDVCADYDVIHTIDFYLHDNNAAIVSVSASGGTSTLVSYEDNHYKYTMKSTNYFGHGHLIFKVKKTEGSSCKCEQNYTIEW